MLSPTPHDDSSHTLCTVLLDDAHATGASSRLYRNLVEEISWEHSEQWDEAWRKAEDAISQGYFAVAFLHYESGAQLLNIAARDQAGAPCSRILIFRECQHLNAEQAHQYLAGLAIGSVAGVRAIRPNLDDVEFTQAIQKVRDYIAAGDTYQVNFTYRLHFSSYGAPASLYLALRQRQPVPYGAFAILPNGEAILSFSPELFVRHQDGVLMARPMKGTAAATGDDSIDQITAEALSHDPKNRAENLMIVDLLRNDLGRIAQTGSVTVPRLFEVTRFSSVLQMTSSIEAKLDASNKLAAIMRALFPCGSITGAPKKRTMEIIREIESEARGLYTGAIGWFDPIPSTNKHATKIPNFCLSVPIRTLELQPEIQGERRGRMGVGAGIVYDSKAEEEFAECQLKARFLTGLTPSFELFETMFANQAQGCRDLAAHLQRLRNSAQHFGFVFDASTIQQQLQQHLSMLSANTDYRIKLSLDFFGRVQVQSAALKPLPQTEGSVGFLFDAEICKLDFALLQHKTTAREQYDAGWQRAEAAGGFDTIFVNPEGRISEGGRSTVFIKLNGEWLTPPLNDGVLPGILRAKMLTDQTWKLREQSISIDEFLQAEQVMLGNSLRGLLPAFRLSNLP